MHILIRRVMCKKSKLYRKFSAEKHKETEKYKKERVKTKNIVLPKVVWLDLKSNLTMNICMKNIRLKWALDLV